jgi:putative redox protein
MIKRYTNGEVTVVWKPELCVHSGICARGLPAVFSPTRRPWIDMSYADTATITAQVDRCPSKALSWEKNSDASDAV